MTNRGGVRFTEEQRERMRAKAVKLYLGGASLQESAEMVGCSAASVAKFLAQSGTPRRPRGDRRDRLPDGMLTTAEAAALIGVSASSLNAMHHRGDCPPRTEAPEGAHRYYAVYWRSDVEKWLAERAKRRLERVRKNKSAKEEHARALAANVVPGRAPDWKALLASCDAKRAANGFNWNDVGRMAGVDPGHISRIRNGDTPEKAVTAFFRLSIWALGSLPDGLGRFLLPLADESARHAS